MPHMRDIVKCIGRGQLDEVERTFGVLLAYPDAGRIDGANAPSLHGALLGICHRLRIDASPLPEEIGALVSATTEGNSIEPRTYAAAAAAVLHRASWWRQRYQGLLVPSADPA